MLDNVQCIYLPASNQIYLNQYQDCMCAVKFLVYIFGFQWLYKKAYLLGTKENIIAQNGNLYLRKMDIVLNSIRKTRRVKCSYRVKSSTIESVVEHIQTSQETYIICTSLSRFNLYDAVLLSVSSLLTPLVMKSLSSHLNLFESILNILLPIDWLSPCHHLVNRHHLNIIEYVFFHKNWIDLPCNRQKISWVYINICNIILYIRISGYIISYYINIHQTY